MIIPNLCYPLTACPVVLAENRVGDRIIFVYLVLGVIGFLFLQDTMLKVGDCWIVLTQEVFFLEIGSVETVCECFGPYV